jgi:hypothetical protein
MTARSANMRSKEAVTAKTKSSPRSVRARMHALLERDADALTRKTIEKALAGDPVCLRLCFERLYPPYKAVPLPIEPDRKPETVRLSIFDHKENLISQEILNE